MKLLALELYKARRRHILLAFAVFLIITFLWVLFSLNYREITVQSWQELLYNLMLIDSIVLPLGVAVFASRSCEIEHKASSFKLLETMMTASQLYQVKLLCGAIQITGMLALRMICFIVLGCFLHFPAQIPYAQMLYTYLSGTAIAVTLFTLHLGLSLFFQNQAIALLAGIFGSFIGLLSLFFPRSIQQLCLWAYYGFLSPVGMDWNHVTRAIHYYWITPRISSFLLLFLWFLAAFFIGKAGFIRKEV